MTKKIDDNLFNELGLDGLSREKKLELTMRWGRLVQKNVIIRILKEMPEEQKKEMDGLLAKKGENMEEIYKFLEEKMPNLDEITKEEINKLRTEIKSDAQRLGIV